MTAHERVIVVQLFDRDGFMFILLNQILPTKIKSLNISIFSYQGIIVGSTVSVLVVSIILVGAQIHHVAQVSTLPVQTDQCRVQNFDNSTTPATTLPSIVASAEVFWLFRLSFMYYALMGLIVMVIVSHITSRLTGGASQDLDESLLLSHFQSKEYKERMSKRRNTAEYTEVNQTAVELKELTQQEKFQEIDNQP